MPASPYKWSSFGNTQVFGLSYGTKRKAEEDDNCDFGLNQLFNDQPQYTSKRLCVWNEPEVTRTAQLTNDSADIVLNEMETNDTVSDTSQLTTGHIQTQQLYNFTNQAYQPSALTMTNENEMLMNINDDDGGVNQESMNDYMSARDAMDGEGAVDYSQYGIMTEQHEGHCFGAEKSPNSGSVRCYCRPSWDTLASNRAFFSDIY